MRRKIAVVSGIWLAVTAWALAASAPAQEPRPPSGAQPSAPQRPSVEKPAAGQSGKASTAPRPAGSEALVSFKDGRLSVRVKDRPLDWVLGEISRVGRVAIVRGGTIGGRLASVEFEGVPLDEGLRQLLADKADFFFLYGAEPNRPGPASLKAVWVYARGSARGLEPVPASEWASTKELREKLTDPDPLQRAQAIEGLIEREGNRAQAEVLQALKDTDGRVRMQALFFALDEGVSVPDEQLKRLALTDPAKDVRVLALQGLRGRPDAREVATRALNDLDPQVRNVAQEVLTGLERASQPREPRPSARQAPRRHGP